MPVYNEKGIVREVMEQILNAPVENPFELLVIDDGSTDGSTEIIWEMASKHDNVVPIRLQKNHGKGFAIRQAIQKMTGDIALIHDADLKYSVADYPRILKPILEGNADAVFGSRFLVKDETMVMFFWHRVANKILAFLVNIFTNMTYTDVETCFKAVRATILKQTPLFEDRFGIEVELAIKLPKWNLRIVEVPISYIGRTCYEGKKIGLRDSMRSLWAIFKYSVLNRSFSTNKGFLILKALEYDPKYNDWLFALIKRFLGRNIVEVGSGIGTISKYLLLYDNVALTDIDPFYLEVLKRRYAYLAHVGVYYYDITQPERFNEVIPFVPDTIICSNVIEHIKDAREVVASFERLLAPGGRLILLIPQGNHLYGAVDRAAGHYKRYTVEEAEECLGNSGFEVEYIATFNKFTVPLWYVRTCILKGSKISSASSIIHNLMVPILKPLDRVLPWKGLSILAVGKKPEAHK